MRRMYGEDEESSRRRTQRVEGEIKSMVVLTVCCVYFYVHT
jgi:hypothetical protein